MESNSVAKGSPKRSLTRQSDFSRLREQGHKVASSRWLTVISNPNQAGYLQYAFSIPRKVGSAVRRNKLRRWGREIIRKQIREGKDWPVDVHFIIRPMPDGFFTKLTLEDFSRVARPERWNVVPVEPDKTTLDRV